jgi:hypothetical protein
MQSSPRDAAGYVALFLPLHAIKSHPWPDGKERRADQALKYFRFLKA